MWHILQINMCQRNQMRKTLQRVAIMLYEVVVLVGARFFEVSVVVVATARMVPLVKLYEVVVEVAVLLLEVVLVARVRMVLLSTYIHTYIYIYIYIYTYIYIYWLTFVMS